MDDLLNYMPELESIQSALDKRFFKNKLNSIQIKWSKHLSTNSAISYYDRVDNSRITISLSWNALKFRERIDLLNTILHQMIHVYCFKIGIHENPHGSHFQNIMNKINKVSGTTITCQHKFKFNNLKQTLLFWRCNGICQHHLPFKGYIVSPVHITPSSRSALWWDRHLHRCGGTFQKVKNPDVKVNDSSSRQSGESDWTVVDTEIMLKKPVSVPVIDLSSSEDESDDNDINTQLVKEIHDNETHMNLNDIILIGQNNVTEIPKLEEAKELFDENRLLLKDYRLQNAAHLLEESYFDIITCPICIEKIQRDLLPRHLNGCLGYSVQIQPFNHSLSPPAKKKKLKSNRSFEEDITSDNKVVKHTRHNLNNSTCFCPCGAEVENTDIDIHLLSCKKPRRPKTKM